MEIKKSKKPIKYDDAIRIMEKRLHNINRGVADELVWILEHEEIYTAGKNHKDREIIDKSIKIVKTNRHIQNKPTNKQIQTAKQWCQKYNLELNQDFIFS